MLRGLPPTALLAALVLACSSQPAPTEPDADTQVPAFKKGRGNPGGGENPGSATYDYAFTGDVATDADGLAVGNVGENDATSVVLDGCCDPTQEQMTLGDNLLNQLDSSPARTCFVGAAYDFSGALNRDKKDVNKVSATFYFRALGSDGATEFKYVLTLDGTIDGTRTNDGDIFPPEDTETTTIGFDQATMATEGKGKGQAGKACIGNAGIAATAILKGTS